MSRHGFRSQPALQRSGGTPSLSLWGIGGLAALGLVVGALVTSLQEHRAPDVQTYGAAALAPAETAPATSPPAPAPSVAVPQPQPVAVSPKPVAKPAARPHPVRVAKAPHVEQVATPSPQKAWEQQRQDYERAVATYNANETGEGYRWAQQNHIRRERYCRVAERRTQAFLQGCLAFTRGDPSPSGPQGSRSGG